MIHLPQLQAAVLVDDRQDQPFETGSRCVVQSAYAAGTSANERMRRETSSCARRSRNHVPLRRSRPSGSDKPVPAASPPDGV